MFKRYKNDNENHCILYWHYNYKVRYITLKLLVIEFHFNKHLNVVKMYLSNKSLFGVFK